MGHILTTVFSVLALVALLHRIAAQARKTAESAKGEPEHREAWPTMPEPQPDTPKQHHSQPGTPKNKNTLRNHPSVQRQAPERMYDRATAKTSIEPTPAPETAAAAPIDANKPHTEAFDLRTAIIYSEILKPKFDE